MVERRRPSIFDLMEKYVERMFEEARRLPLGLPFEEEFARRRRREREPEDIEEWLRDPFEEMMKRLEEELPEEFKDFVTEEETPEGKVRRYGPFIYGFSYTKEPGKEPEIKEFGNIRPSYRRIEPIPRGEREPLIDTIEQKDYYEVVAELPGVEKRDIKLHATEDSLEIRTENEKRYYKEVHFDMPVKPETAKATYKNGVLSVRIAKKEGEKKKTTIPLK
ncbi:MAG: Hsp20/alpha crystallin family protein [Methanophagales archaeon]|nr:Hsp20/alpha crystallin family protein [Methanophagales archaeon]RLG35179.1 MAG: Hsp20/alpha crystallin family protein [Methanosarcinales archaeon]